MYQTKMMSKVQKKNYLLYCILLLGLFVIFREPLATLIEAILIQPILNHITSSLATDLAILSSLPIVIFLLWNNKDHRWIFKYTGALLILFATYRFDGNWFYTPSYLLKNTHLTYIDLSAISVGILFIRHWYQMCTKRKDQEPQNSTRSEFIEDNSIQEEEDDTYERIQVAKQIANQILGTKNKKSFAIGITGLYGSGKTSFINLITKVLEKEVRPPLIVNFNPWNAETVSDLQKLLFDELSIALAKEDHAVSTHMYHYYRRLNGKATFIGKLLNNLRDVSVIFNRDLNDEKDKINKMMINLPCKIIIIIDDLDRLHNEEVIEVLRLIRNTANFGNITYIVAYDKQYVEESIKKINEQTYKNYLDKIFQIEIPLPKSESYLISNAFIKSIEKVIKPEELIYVRDEFVSLNFESEYEEAISAAFNSQRDIVRFVNSFSIAYQMISEEVDFVQLLYIQILKFRYPIAYSTLYDRRKEVLDTSEDASLNNKSYSLRKDAENGSDDYVILGLLKNNLGHYDLTQVKYILNHLFSLNLTLRYKDKTRTITNPEVFDLFFTGRLSSIGLSESAFVKNMLGEDVKEIETYVAEQLDSGRHKPLLHRILAIKRDDFVDKDHYEQIWYIFVQKVVPAYIKNEGSRSIPFDGFITAHFDERQHIAKKYYSNDEKKYGEHLNKLLSFHKESYIFISEIVRKLMVRNRNVDIFPREHFLQIQLDCLTVGLKDNPHTISREVVWLFWGIREYHAIEDEFGDKNDKETTWNIHPKAVEILHPYLSTKDLTHLLKSLISIDHNEERYGLHDKLIQDVFKEVFWLKNTLLRNKHTDNNAKDEFLNFLSYYEQTSGFVEYEFKFFDIG